MPDPTLQNTRACQDFGVTTGTRLIVHAIGKKWRFDGVVVETSDSDLCVDLFANGALVSPGVVFNRRTMQCINPDRIHLEIFSIISEHNFSDFLVEDKHKKAMDAILNEAKRVGCGLRYDVLTNYVGIRGHYEMENSCAVAVSGSSPCIDRLLFTVAHEIRHGQHHAFGMFAGYYREKVSLVGDEFLKFWASFDINEGHQAEKDCDRWACALLSRYDIHICQTTYPIESVLGFQERLCARRALGLAATS